MGYISLKTTILVRLQRLQPTMACLKKPLRSIRNMTSIPWRSTSLWSISFPSIAVLTSQPRLTNRRFGVGFPNVSELENYDASEIAKVATDHGLFEEAFTIYKNYDQHTMATNVVNRIVSVNLGLDFATKINIQDRLYGLCIKDSMGEHPGTFCSDASLT